MIEMLPVVFETYPTLLGAWDSSEILAVRLPEMGSVNATLLVRTTAGRYALRAYLRADRTRILHEHELITYAASRGVPAVMPLPHPEGTTVLEHIGLFYALFPEADGEQRQRAELTVTDAAAMGRCLAQMHLALADAPPHLARPRGLAVDREATLRTIASYLEQAQGDPLVTRHLQGQRAYLETSPEAIADLTSLVHQIIHGDFTETNLFFDCHHVCAIIDWENSYVAPRAWEVIRTLHLVFDFAPALCSAFVSAYRAVCPLACDELDLAAQAYAQMRAHDLWIIEAVLIRGDARPRRFLDPVGFQPILPRWVALRPLLDG